MLGGILALFVAAVLVLLWWQIARKSHRRVLFREAAHHAHTPSESAHVLLDDAQAALAGGDAVAALRLIEDACILAGDDPMVLRRAEVLRSRVA